MTKRILAAAATLLVPAIAFAQVDVTLGEQALVFKDTPRAVAADQARTAPALSQTPWKYVGGEAGWVLENPAHRMTVQAGQLVHAADCPVMASLSAPAKGLPIDLGYTGA